MILALVGCSESKKETCRIGMADKDYGFLTSIKRTVDFDYLKMVVDFRQFGISNVNWLRNSENLKQFYASIKKVGLKKFISQTEFNQALFASHFIESCWENKSLNQILENLIASKSDTTGFDKYYVEFWNRREEEKNAETVLKIFIDIKNKYSDSIYEIQEKWEPEPIIIGLLEFENKLKRSDSTNLKKITKEYFEYLKSIQLFSSANNLVNYYRDVELHDNDTFDLDITQLIDQIEKDSVDCDTYWNWRNNAKWYLEFYDYGP